MINLVIARKQHRASGSIGIEAQELASQRSGGVARSDIEMAGLINCTKVWFAESRHQGGATRAIEVDALQAVGPVGEKDLGPKW